MMWFLMKGMFWFSLVLLALPIFDDRPEVAEANGPEVELGATLNALGVALGDIRDICQRHPDVCVTGSEAMTALGMRARDGARVAYRYLDSTLIGEDGSVTVDMGAGDGHDLALTQPQAMEADPQPTGTIPAELDRLAVEAALRAALATRKAGAGMEGAEQDPVRHGGVQSP